MSVLLRHGGGGGVFADIDVGVGVDRFHDVNHGSGDGARSDLTERHGEHIEESFLGVFEIACCVRCEYDDGLCDADDVCRWYALDNSLDNSRKWSLLRRTALRFTASFNALSVTSCVFFGSAACSSKLDGNASPRRDIVDEGVDGGVWVGACVYVCCGFTSYSLANGSMFSRCVVRHGVRVRCDGCVCANAKRRTTTS